MSEHRLPFPSWTPLMIGLFGAVIVFGTNAQPLIGAAACLLTGVTGWLLASRAELLLSQHADRAKTLKEADSDRRRFELQLSESQSQLKDQTSELAAAQNHTKDLQTQLQTAQGQLTEALGKVQELQKSAVPGASSREIADLELKLSRANLQIEDDARKHRKVLEEQRRGFEARTAALDSQIQDLGERAEELARQRNKAARDLESLQ
ncbi:MAG: hypothetical protein ACPG4T_11590, partial [Nannocystaceae bacterium]